MAIRFTLRQLEYFVAVGETGSIAQASERVNVSPPSISASISQLEAEFGLQLFIRKHAHGLSLTHGGRRFLGEAKKLLESAEGLRVLAGDINNTIAGPLSVGCLKTFAPLVLPELRQRFEALYPDVDVKQVEGDHANLLGRLQNAEVDVCLTYDLVTPADIHFEPLAELPAFVMLPGSHKLAGQATLTPEELADEPMVLLDMPISADYFLSVFQAAGLKPNIAERTQDIAVARSMVANGFGYSLANVRQRMDIAPDGKPLTFIPLTGGLRPMRLGLATSGTSHKTRILEVFQAHCRDLISEDYIPGLKML